MKLPILRNSFILEGGDKGAIMEPIIKAIEVKSVLTKSNLPVGDYSINPYVGCTHACKYCYASFMKRFTNHSEEWGAFLDVKYWPKIKKPEKYAGKELFFGSVTDPYNPQEEIYYQGSRLYWEALDHSIRDFTSQNGLEYVRDDDTVQKGFYDLPTVVNFFYHEEVKKSAKSSK